MNIKQKGKETFLTGFSCGEAVIKTAKESNILQVPEELIRVGSAFKAGIGLKGDVCGALLGAVSIIGLKYGRTNNEDSIGLVNKKTAEFYDRFKEKFGTVLCKEITKEFRDKDAFDSPERKEFCSELVSFILEELEKTLMED